MEGKKAPIYGKCLDITRTIPFGLIMLYMDVAKCAGSNCAHTASHPLSELPEDSDVPWWRVVGKHRDGKHAVLLTTGDRRAKQRELLEAEGVGLDDDDRFILEDYRYRPVTLRWLAARG